MVKQRGLFSGAFMLVSGSFLFTPVTVSADTLGVGAGTMGWYYDTTGTIRSGGDPIDIADDLGIGDDLGLTIFAYLEHPIPLLPNGKLRYSDINLVDFGSVNTTLKNVDFDGNVSTDLDLSHADLILYYEVLDNVVSLDLGVQVKIFDGQLIVRQTDTAAGSSNTKIVKEEIDEFVPMLYGAAEIALPPSLAFGVEVSAMSIGDNTLYDVSAKGSMRIAFLNAELGYRVLSADLDDVNDIAVDAELKGPYLSLGLVF